MSENSFVRGLDPWLDRLGSLRNVVRQELVTRQLHSHLPSPAPGARQFRVLDVGAGQGTQALRLARAGHDVTAVEPDDRMRAAFATATAALDERTRKRVTLLAGDLTQLDQLTSPAAYDLVLCHGVLMYLPASNAAIARLATRLAPGGRLSVVARNGDAMAWRPAVKHDWAGALAMLDEIDQSRTEQRNALYRNEIGVDARADTVAGLTTECEAAGLRLEAWYGIRVATDHVPVDTPTPPAHELRLLLDVEERLGRTDPYRALGTLVHVIARRSDLP